MTKYINLKKINIVVFAVLFYANGIYAQSWTYVYGQDIPPYPKGALGTTSDGTFCLRSNCCFYDLTSITDYSDIPSEICYYDVATMIFASIWTAYKDVNISQTDFEISSSKDPQITIHAMIPSEATITLYVDGEEYESIGPGSSTLTLVKNRPPYGQTLQPDISAKINIWEETYDIPVTSDDIFWSWKPICKLETIDYCDNDPPPVMIEACCDDVSGTDNFYFANGREFKECEDIPIQPEDEEIRFGFLFGNLSTTKSIKINEYETPLIKNIETTNICRDENNNLLQPGSFKIVMDNNDTVFILRIDEEGDTKYQDYISESYTYDVSNTKKHQFLVYNNTYPSCIDERNDLQVETDILAASMTTSLAKCKNGSLGSITVIPSGGEEFIISCNGSSKTIAKGSSATFYLNAGTYSISITNENGCSITKYATVDSFEGIDADLKMVACTNSNEGGIIVTSSNPDYAIQVIDEFGSAQPVSYENKLSNVDELKYVQIVEPNTGCYILEDFIPSPGLSLLGEPDITHVTNCNPGEENGLIELKVQNNTGSCTYAANSPSGGLNNLPVGIYGYTVSDKFCAVSGTAIINQVFKITGASVVHAACSDGTGSITANITGGVGPYNIQAGIYSNINTPELTISDLPKGSYELSVTDKNRCTSEYEPTLKINASQPLYFYSINKNVTCNGYDDGMIDIINTRGEDGDYDLFLWTYEQQGDDINYSLLEHEKLTDQPDNNRRTFNDLEPGNYVVEMENAGCNKTYEEEFQISDPPLLEINNISTTPVICNTDAYVELDITGGSAEYYYYDIGNGYKPYYYNSGFTIPAPGDYNVEVMDFFGCTASSNFTIDEADMISANLSVTHDWCNTSNGQVKITAYGGSGNYNIEPDCDSRIGNTFYYYGLSAGTIHVTISDNEADCDPYQEDIVIQANQSLNLNVEDYTEYSCGNEGEIYLGADGGDGDYTYYIDNGTYVDDNSYGDFYNLPSGTYQVWVVDGNNCLAVADNIGIDEADAVDISNVNVEHQNCFGDHDGIISFDVTGGSGDFTYYMYEPIALESTGNFTGLAPGDYKIKIVDDYNYCPAEYLDITLHAANEITANISFSDNTCYEHPDGSIVMNVSGGQAPFEYSINGYEWGNGDFNQLPKGLYHPAVIDDIGCLKEFDDIYLDGPEPLRIDDISKTDASIPGCYDNPDGSVRLIASGGSGQKLYSIDNGATWLDNNGEFFNLHKGVYQVLVSDECGNVLISNPVTINGPDEIKTVNLSHQDITCYGFMDGIISFQANGGSGIFEYSFDDKTTWYDQSYLEGLDAGNYIIWARDSYGCEQQAGQVEIISPEEIVAADILLQDASCFNGFNGTIEIHATGGSGNFEYSYTNGASFVEENFKNNCTADDYDIIIRETHNYACAVSVGTVTIGQPDKIGVDDVIVQDLTCYQSGDGQITIEASGGSGEYEYSFNGIDFQTEKTKGELSAGSYLFAVRDAYDITCVAYGSESIVHEPAELIETVPPFIEDVTCYGGNNGSITLSATGGTGLLSYSYDGGNSYVQDNEYVNIPRGNYHVVIKDEHECLLDAGIQQVNEPAPLAFTNVRVKDATCNGSSNGEIEITASGGSLEYEYSFDNGGYFQENNINIACSAGEYPLVIRDKNDTDCILTGETISVSEPTPLSVSNIKTKDVSCFGWYDGLISISAHGGSGNYKYSYNGGVSFESESISASNAEGNYLLLMRDVIDENCILELGEISLNQPEKVIINDVFVKDAACHNTENGELTVFAQGGNNSFMYSFDNGLNWQAENAKDQLASGTYLVVAEDASVSACVSEAFEVEIKQPSPIEIQQLTIDHVTCFGDDNGTVSIDAIGGPSGSYEFALESSTFVSSGFFPNLTAGQYNLKIRDLWNTDCVADFGDVEVTQPNQLQFTAPDISHVSCFGGSNATIELNVSGGSGVYEYATLTSDDFGTVNRYNNLCPGKYAFKVRDANDRNCQAISPIYEVTQPAKIIINNIETKDIDCYASDNGEINIFAQGGNQLEYSFDNGANFQDEPLAQHLKPFYDYQVYVRDKFDQQCFVAGETYTLNEVPEIVIEDVASTDILCKGDNTGDILLTASGGSGYLDYAMYSPADNSPSAIASAEYWANPLKEHLYAGNYQLVARDQQAHHCYKTQTIELIEPEEKLAFQDIPFDKSFYHGNINVTQCRGDDGWFRVNTSGGTGTHYYQYTLPGNESETQVSALFENLSAGHYNISVTDDHQCRINSWVVLRDTSKLEAEVIENNSTECDESIGNAKISVKGGIEPYEYLWNHTSGSPLVNTSSTFSISGLAAGVYHVSVTDANGCFKNVPLGISNPQGPEAAINSVTPATCSYRNDGSASVQLVSGNLPVSVVWTDDNHSSSYQISNLFADRYIAELTDVNGCKTAIDVVVPGPKELLIHAIDTEQPLCFGDDNGTVTVTPAGGTPDYNFTLTRPGKTYPMQISGSESTFRQNIQKDDYQIHITDQNGCEINASFNVDEPDELVIDMLEPTDPSCFGFDDGSIRVSAKGGVKFEGNYFYEIPGKEITDIDALFSGLLLGNYPITVKDKNECLVQADINLNQPDLLEITSLTHTEPLCYGTNTATIDVSARGGTPDNGEYQYSLLLKSDLADQMITQDAHFENQYSGDYELKVEDSHSCVAGQLFTINQPAPVRLVNFNYTMPLCYGGNDGSFEVKATGGILYDGMYDFKLTKSGSITNEKSGTAVIMNKLSAGNYTLQVADDHFCTYDTILHLGQPSQIKVASIISDPPKCHGENSGKLSLRIEGGTVNTKNYDVGLYQDGKLLKNTKDRKSFFYDELEAGNYSMKIKDAHNCIINETANIQETPLLEILDVDPTEPSCYGYYDGALEIYYQGGTGSDFIFELTKNILEDDADSEGYYLKSKSPEFTYLDAGTYSARITDMNNCKADKEIILQNPDSLTFDIFDFKEPPCFDWPGGELKADVSGGNPGYWFHLKHDGLIRSKNKDNFVVFDNLESGAYQLMVEDQNLCSKEKSFYLKNPDELTITDLKISPPLCTGNSDAVISVKAAGGNPDKGAYKYVLKELNNTILQKKYSKSVQFENISAGKYYIEVSDDNNCIINQLISVTAPKPLAEPLLTFTEPLCYGSRDGSVSILPSGGSPAEYGYTIQLTRDNQNHAFVNSSNALIEDLAAGNYEVTITDKNNCRISAPFILSQPGELKLEALNIELPKCYGSDNATITSKVSGGTPSNNQYTFAVSGYNTEEAIYTGDELKAEGFGFGVYTMKVTDVNNCRLEKKFFVVEPLEFKILDAVGNKPLCKGANDGSIYVKAFGGTGSDFTYTYEIYQHDERQDVIEASVANFTEVNGGEYIIKVFDANKCMRDTSIEISEPPAIVVEKLSINEPRCFGSSDGYLTVKAAGGIGDGFFEYLLTDINDMEHARYYGTEATFDFLHAGTYKLSATNINQCKFDTLLEVESKTKIEIWGTSDTLQCKNNADGEIEVYVSGGTEPYAYRWYHNNALLDYNGTHLTGCTAGTYVVDVRDANNCPGGDVFAPGIMDTLFVYEPEMALAFNTEYVSHPIQFGDATGEVSLHADGGWGNYKYSNSGADFGASSIFTGLSAGMYDFSVKDNMDCTEKLQVEIIQPDKLELMIDKTVHLSCYGQNNGLITAHGKGGTQPYYFTIDDSQRKDIARFDNLPAGNYDIKMYDANNFSESHTVHIEQPDEMVPEIIDIKKPDCGVPNGEIEVSVQGGTWPYFYKWNDKASQITARAVNLAADIYTVGIMDENFCETKLSIELSNITGPAIENITVTPVSCFGGNNGKAKVTVVNKGNYNISWNDPLNQSTLEASQLKAGKYMVTIKDNNNCKVSGNVEVLQPEEIKIYENEIVHPSCFNYQDGSITPLITGGIEPYQYKWEDAMKRSLTSQDILAGRGDGNYLLVVTDANLCQKTHAFTLIEPQQIEIDVSGSKTICQGQEVELDAGNPGSKHLWQSENGFYNTDQIVTLTQAGLYTVTVTDKDNCFNSANFTLQTVDDLLKAQFLLQDYAVVGDEVVMFDITQPVPDNITWHIPQGLQAISSVYGSVMEVYAPQEGKFTIGLEANIEACHDFVEKTLTITNGDEGEARAKSKMVLVSNTNFYPNPTKDKLSLDIHLNNEGFVKIDIFTVLGQQMVYSNQLDNSKKYRIDIDVTGIQAGTYILRIITKDEMKAVSFVKI